MIGAVVVADLLLMLAGHAVAGPAARRAPGGVPLVPLAALSLLTGCGLLAAVTTLVGVLGGPTSAWPVIAPVMIALAVLGVAVAARYRHPRPGRPDPSWLGYAVALALAGRFAVTAWRVPVLSNDEYMMWAMRGRLLASGQLDPLVFGGEALDPMYPSREYPLGVPALYSWVSAWVGPRGAEFAAHAQVPLLGCAGLLVAVWAVRRYAAGAPAALAGALVAPAFFALTWSGRYTGVLLFADLPEAAAALAVVLLLLRWVTDRDRRWLALAAGPALAAVYFKEEGLVFVAAPCLAAALCTLRLRGDRPRPRESLAPLLVLVGALLARLPWQLWLVVQGIPNRFLRRPLPRYGVADELHLARVVGTDMLRDWPIPFGFWLLPAALVLTAAVAVLTPATRRPAGYLAATLAIVVAGIWAQYLLTALATRDASHGIGPYIAFNAPRVLTLPTVLAWFAALLTASAAIRPAAPLDHPHLGREVAGSGVPG